MLAYKNYSAYFAYMPAIDREEKRNGEKTKPIQVRASIHKDAKRFAADTEVPLGRLTERGLRLVMGMQPKLKRQQKNGGR